MSTRRNRLKTAVNIPNRNPRPSVNVKSNVVRIDSAVHEVIDCTSQSSIISSGDPRHGQDANEDKVPTLVLHTGDSQSSFSNPPSVQFIRETESPSVIYIPPSPSSVGIISGPNSVGPPSNQNQNNFSGEFDNFKSPRHRHSSFIQSPPTYLPTSSSREFRHPSGSGGQQQQAGAINSNANSGTETLRQRLQNSSQLTRDSKYSKMRKEFLTRSKSKKNSDTPIEISKMKMLDFAFWNPPKKKRRRNLSGVEEASASTIKGKETIIRDLNDDKSEDNKKFDKKAMTRKGRSRSKSTSSSVSIVPVEEVVENEQQSKKKDKKESKSEANRKRRTSRGISISSSIVTIGSDTESGNKSSTERESPSKEIGPRVKVGPGGNLILDEKSLIIPTSESARVKNTMDEMETITDLNNSSVKYKRAKAMRGNDWPEKETLRFYKALSTCGCDFSMMTKYFPARTRGELKAKFKREDKKNSAQISAALLCQFFDSEAEEELENMADDEDDINVVKEIVIGGEGS